jgi:hypothetical protein
MATTVYTTTFKFKRGKAASWVSANPILAEAEPGYELDTGKLKIGNGVTAWNDLAYFGGDSSLSLDEKSLTISGTKTQLAGFDTAIVGAIPSKGENGIEWINPKTQTYVLYGGSATDLIGEAT